jgi:hypothetical protein
MEIRNLSPLSECIARKPSFELYAPYERPKSFAGWDEKRGLWRAERNFYCDQMWSLSHNIHTVPSCIPFKLDYHMRILNTQGRILPQFVSLLKKTG